MELKTRIVSIAGQLADEYGVELVDLELAGSERKVIVRVFIDKENGVTLEDCERFSRALSVVFDVEDPIQARYVLEVSSPGMDRPLVSPMDFRRNSGRLCKITTRENIDGNNVFKGRIHQVEEEYVSLLLDTKSELTFPYVGILKARLEVDFS